MATIDDIVKNSGVSRSTVFRFLKGHRVREDSEKRIIAAMEELDFDLNKINGQSSSILEVSVANHYEDTQAFLMMIRGIMNEAQKKGVPVQIVERVDKQIDEDYSKWAKTSNKGIIVIGKNREDESKEGNYLKELKIPHIFINRVISDDIINYVSINSEKAAYDIVSFLIEKGHKEILVSGNSKNSTLDDAKMRGYIKALKDNDIEIKEKNYLVIENKNEFEKEIKAVLNSKDLPTAYFGLTDSYATQFINIAHAMNIAIPEQISVVGMNYLDAAKYSFPRLTTVEIPYLKMGKVSVEMLLRLMNSELENVKLLMEHKIVENESVKIQ